MSDAPRPRAGTGAGPGAGPRRGARGGQASRRDYVGCGLWALGFVVLVIASFTVGILLRPGSGTEATTLTEGGSGDARYRIEGERDEADGEACLTLVVGDDEVTGQCGTSVDAGSEEGRYLITSAELPDGTTVAFAPVPPGTETVGLTLADGTTPTVEVRTSESTGIDWFVHTSEAAVAGPAEMLDAEGEPVSPPR